MRVHKTKVEYKLALQEKPEGTILTYYYKTNNLTRINWLSTRLIIASNKIRHEIPFKTKRVKYTAIWKKSVKIVKESKLSFYYHVSLLNFFPSTTILIFSLIFIVFPPPPPPHILIVFPFPPHFDCFDRVDVGSMWGRCRVDVGSKWGRCRVDVGSMQGRCGVDVGSM